MAAVCTWLRRNKLSLNVSKTKSMWFYSPGRARNTTELNVTVEDAQLECVDKFKYLGVFLDSHITWEKHVDYISGKVSRKIGLLRRLKNFLPRNTLNMLYKALILSTFDYCDVVWSNCSQGFLGRLQRLQNRAARVILGEDNYARIDVMHSELKWKKLHERQTFHKCVLMKKCVDRIAPAYLSEQVTRVSDIHSRVTRRSSSCLYVRRSRTNYGTRRFFVSASNQFNSLPDQVRNASDLSKFKHEYLKHV